MSSAADRVADASLRHLLATSGAPSIRRLRALRRRVRAFTLPAPRVVVLPARAAFVAIRGAWHYAFRLLVCEPIFKAHCRSYGRGVRTDVFIHWITGRGDIIVGDDVLVDGKCSITFASRYVQTPSLIIGDHTGIGHGCTFSIGKRITIGRHCRIAAQVWMFDSSGHPADPQARLAGLPPDADEVKPITIGDNVWIGGRAIVHPGVTIGAHSVIAAGSVVTGDVPPCTMVAGNPARKVGQLPIPEYDTVDRSGRDSVR